MSPGAAPLFLYIYFPLWLFCLLFPRYHQSGPRRDSWETEIICEQRNKTRAFVKLGLSKNSFNSHKCLQMLLLSSQCILMWEGEWGKARGDVGGSSISLKLGLSQWWWFLTLPILCPGQTADRFAALKEKIVPSLGSHELLWTGTDVDVQNCLLTATVPFITTGFLFRSLYHFKLFSVSTSFSTIKYS